MITLENFKERVLDIFVYIFLVNTNYKEEIDFCSWRKREGYAPNITNICPALSSAVQCGANNRHQHHQTGTAYNSLFVQVSVAGQ